jgi:hypothetical protein
MKASDDLLKVMSTEVELASTLLDTMTRQRSAIISMDAESVAETVIREQNLIKPMIPLERERMRLAAEIIGKRRLGNDEAFPLQEVLACLAGDEVHPVQVLGERLKVLTRQITEVNRQNRLLLEQSLKFVRENIRALTENYSRNLIDQRI